MKERTLSEYSLFAEAWIFLAFARLVLVFVPFRRIANMLGKVMYEVPADLQQDPKVLAAVSVAIIRAGARSPWRTKCFEQAIASKIMLRLRGIRTTVYFGISKNGPGEMRAHAWLKVNDTIVTGGPDISQFTIVSWFGS